MPDGLWLEDRLQPGNADQSLRCEPTETQRETEYNQELQSGVHWNRKHEPLSSSDENVGNEVHHIGTAA